MALGTVTGAYWSGEAVGKRILHAYGMLDEGKREMDDAFGGGEEGQSGVGEVKGNGKKGGKGEAKGTSLGAGLVGL